MKQKSKVVLVGAGPGDPALLTVKGRRWLAQADVVVYDRLVSTEILAYAPQARLIYVGKEQDHHPIPQAEINRILAREAAQNQLVVRLKGGDPFLFGRGAEELEHLAQAGIPFEVVPGVTSAVAALSYAGIPATHRSCASSLHIITGHAKAGGQLEIDYEALARLGGTLVFLMGVASRAQIVAGLLAAGLPGETPAAVVENGTLPRQRKILASLAEIDAKAQEAAIQSPAILAVGGVCGVDPALDWFGQLPLLGRTVVVTRPQKRAGTLAQRLADCGAEVLPLPCIRTEEIASAAAQAALRDLSGYAWLVLTSPQGVEAMFHLLEAQGLDARALAPVKLAAIGASTAAELARQGLRADYIPAHYDAVHLAGGLLELLRPTERVLLLRAEAGTPELVERLAAAGVSHTDITVYRTHAACPESAPVAARLAAGEVDYVTFTSASTVAGFAAALPEAARYPFTAVCIGASSAAAAQAQGYRTITAENATIEALIGAIIKEAVAGLCFAKPQLLHTD